MNPDSSDKFDSLKVSRKQIEQNIKLTDRKLDRLTSILHKKMIKDGRQPEDMISTNDGYRVSDYRLNHTSSKSITLSKLRNDVTVSSSGTGSSNNNAYSSSSANVDHPNFKKFNHDDIIKRACKRVDEDMNKTKAIRIEKRNHLAALKPTVPSVPPSFLPNRYARGELPCTIEHGTSGNFLSWECPMENLNFEYYLPIFFDGLQCHQHPISFLARQGAEDMLFWARDHPQCVKNCIKSLVPSIRNALWKLEHDDVLLGALRAIQMLIKAQCALELVPYCKQFLGPMTRYMSDEVNTGD